MNRTSDNNGSHKIGIGIGIATLAAAAAGAYYLYGSDKAARNRRHVKSWMLRMKAEVMDQIEDMKDVSQAKYDEIIEKVSEKYAAIKDIDKDELRALASRMKSHWKEIREDVSDTVGGEMEKAAKKAKKQ